MYKTFYSIKIPIVIMLIEPEMAFDCPFFPFHGIGNLNAKLMLKINYFHSSLNRLDKAVLGPKIRIKGRFAG